MMLKRYIPIGIFFICALLLQLIFSAAGVVFLLGPVTVATYYALVLVGLCLLMGFAGQISIGHAGFFGIGSYVQAVLVTTNLLPLRDTPFVSFLDSLGFLISRNDVLENEILSLSPWIALLLAIIITIIVAFLIGIPVLKLKGHYLAMATLGFGIIIHLIVYSVDIFGLSDGISGIPEFALVPGVSISGRLVERVGNFYIAVIVLCLGLLVAINLVHSRVGRALRAIHGNESAAGSLGINASRYKLYTFVLSAVFAAVGGALLVHFNASIGPSGIDVIKSVRFVAIVAAGGMDSIWGVVYMGYILNFISLRQVFGTFDDIFFAAVLIIIMLFLPKGLIRASYFKRQIAFLQAQFAGPLGRLRARLGGGRRNPS